jgi:hypothetical protein
MANYIDSVTLNQERLLLPVTCAKGFLKNSNKPMPLQKHYTSKRPGFWRQVHWRGYLPSYRF